MWVLCRGARRCSPACRPHHPAATCTAPRAPRPLAPGTARWWPPKSSRAPPKSRWATFAARSRSCAACTTPTPCRWAAGAGGASTAGLPQAAGWAEAGRLVSCVLHRSVQCAGLAHPSPAARRVPPDSHTPHHPPPLPPLPQFLGACTKREPYILVTELMSGGSLADAFRRPQVGWAVPGQRWLAGRRWWADGRLLRRACRAQAPTHASR